MNAAAGSGADRHGVPTTGSSNSSTERPPPPPPAADPTQDYQYYCYYSPPGEGALYHVSPPPVGRSQCHLEKYQKLQQQYSTPAYSSGHTGYTSHGLPAPPQYDHQLKDHHPTHHRHQQLLQGAVPAGRQCRLGYRRLTSMGYGVMLCTFLWVFLYTLTFSCCVGNSRLEVVASSSSHGGEKQQLQGGGYDRAALVAGSTRRLQHDLHHRRREAPLLQGGRDHGAGGNGNDDHEGGFRRGVGYSFLQGGGAVVPGRRLEEDEDDTIYTLPDEERGREDGPQKHRSTWGDDAQEGGDNNGGDQEDGADEERRHHGRYVLNRADDDDDQHDDDDRGADEDDYRPGHPPRTPHTRRDGVSSRGSAGNKHNNRRSDLHKPPTGDNTSSSKTSSLNNPPTSDSSNNSNHHNNKNRIRYDNGKPPRRRGGRGSRSRALDPSEWTKEGYSRKLPHGLIIGVKKGGTRALLEFLRVHPDIRAPGPEPHFFDRNYDKGLEWYRSQMPPTLDSQLTLEKTPSYFVTKGVPGRIFNMSRDIKLIVVVRDPVTRAISDYTQSSSKRTDVKAFENMAFLDNSTGLVDTSWGAIRIGVYAKHLERWLRYFPLTQIHFVSGERLISDPAAELAKVQDFLGLKRVITDKHFYFNSTKGFPCLKKPEGSGNPHCLGKTKGRPHPKVDAKVIKRLHDFYRPFNAKFYQMTNIDFGWP